MSVTDFEAGAIPSHDTATVDKTWDAAANLKRLGDNPGRAKLRAMHAWVDSNGDPEKKASYKLPHHEVAADGTVGAANLAGVRNALSRLPQSNIPAADENAVRNHLNRHLNKSRSSAAASERPGTWVGELEAHYWAMEPRRLAALTQLAAEGRLEAQLTASPEAIEAARQRGRPKAISGGVVTVPLKGVLAPVTGLLALLFEIPNPLDVFQTAMREAIADPDVGAIVIEVDSPGGVVDGIPEAAAALKSMRGSKPIVA